MLDDERPHDRRERSPERETQRVVRFYARVGHLALAARKLGVCDATFDAARGYGRMQATTRERVLAALAREERNETSGDGNAVFSGTATERVVPALGATLSTEPDSAPVASGTIHPPHGATT